MNGLMGCILNQHLYLFGQLVKDYSMLQSVRRNA